MPSQFIPLSNQIDSFYKEAGLLKVPEEVLTKASEFIISRYSQIMLKKLSDLFTAYGYRKISQDDITSQILDIQSGLSYFNAGSDKAFLQWADDDHSIYHFSLSETSEQTGLEGMFARNKTRPLSFGMSKTNENEFDFLLQISYDNIDVYVHESGLTFKQCKSLFGKHIDEIEYVLEALRQFYNNFEMFGDQRLKRLQMCYGICKRNIKEYGNDANRDFIIMTIPVNTLPYSQGAKANAVNIGVKFILSENTAKVYGDEKWSGLWQGNSHNDPSHQLPYIGTLYVAATVDKDWENILSFGETELLNQIKYMISTTRHELQHFIQSFVDFIKQIRSAGTPAGSSKSKNKQQNVSSKDQAHELRDVEFYTRLSDAIEEFNNIKTKLPAKLHEIYAKYFIDAINSFDFAQKIENHKSIINYDEQRLIRFQAQDIISQTRVSSGHFYFAALKERMPERYQKAVKEFYKAAM